MASRVEAVRVSRVEEVKKTALRVARVLFLAAVLSSGALGVPAIKEVRRLLDYLFASPVSAPVPELPLVPVAAQPAEEAHYRVEMIGNPILDSEGVLEGTVQDILRFYRRSPEQKYEVTWFDLGGRVGLIYGENPSKSPLLWRPSNAGQSDQIEELGSGIREPVVYAVNLVEPVVFAVSNPRLVKPVDPEEITGLSLLALTTNGRWLVEGGEVVQAWSLAPAGK